MKVICIDDSPGQNYKTLPPRLKKVFGKLMFGKIYTVIAEDVDLFDRPMYQLEELPHPEFPTWGWRKERFAPLSSIDETEFERSYNKELV